MKQAILIEKLVKINIINYKNVLHRCTDIVRLYTECVIYPYTVYQQRWLLNLQDNDKYEECNVLMRNINIINKMVKNPSSIFALLDFLSAFANTNITRFMFNYKTSPATYHINASLPHDYLFVLQGISTDSILWRKNMRKFIYKGNFDPSLVQVTKRVLDIGNMVRFILDQESTTKSLLMQRAFSVCQDILDDYMSYACSIEHKYSLFNIPKFLAFLKDIKVERLKAATIIYNTVSGLKGNVLFNKIYNISSHGNDAIFYVANEMSKRTLQMIDEMIKAWITKGELIDSYDEFFIELNDIDSKCSNWWSDKYVMKSEHLPKYYTDVQLDKIFYTGKALNFLREFDHPVNLELDGIVNMNELIEQAYEKANKQLITLFTEKYFLLKVTNNMYNYMLIGRGDFANAFIEIDVQNIMIQFSQLLHMYSKYEIDGLDVLMTDDNWCFTYNVKSPLSAIFKPSDISNYVRVSSILLKLKEVEHRLGVKREEHRKERDFCIVIFEMIHLIQLVLDFFHQHVLQKSFKMFYDEIKNINNIDELLIAHKKHVNSITRGCWCSKKGEKCRKILYELIEIIYDILDDQVFLKEGRDNFYSKLLTFKEELSMHEASGAELVKPLSRVFFRDFQYV